MDETSFVHIIESLWGLAPRGAAALMAHAEPSPQCTPITATPPPEVSAGVLPTLNRLKSALRRRGVAGHIALRRRVQQYSEAKRGFLELATFKHLVKAEFGEDFGHYQRPHDVDRDLRLLFSELTSKQGHGLLNTNHLVAMLCDNVPMNARRKSETRAAFEELASRSNHRDVDQQGSVPAKDVIGTLAASDHPDVKAGARTNETVHAEFLQALAAEGIVDDSGARATVDQFLAAHEHISATIEMDSAFASVVRSVWQMSDHPGSSAGKDLNGTARVRVIVTHADGRATVEEIDEGLYAQVQDEQHLKLVVAQQLGIRPQDVAVLDPAAKEGSGAMSSSIEHAARQKRAQNPATIAHAAGKAAIDSARNSRIYDSSDGRDMITKKRTPLPERRTTPPQGPMLRLPIAKDVEVDGIGRPRKAVVGRGERLLSGLPRHLQSSLHSWPSSVAKESADVESFPRRVPNQPVFKHSIVIGDPDGHDAAPPLPPPPPPLAASASRGGVPHTQPPQSQLSVEVPPPPRHQAPTNGARPPSPVKKKIKAQEQKKPGGGGGGGTIAPEVLAREFDAGAHPDVREGRATHNEVADTLQAP